MSHSTVETAATASTALKCVLVVLDASAVALVWTIVLLYIVRSMPSAKAIALVATVVFASLAFARSQRLYQVRPCALRSEEKARLLRVAVIDALVVLALAGLLDVDVPLTSAAWGALFTFLVLAVFRSGFHQWLTTNRAHGRFLEPVVVAGANDESDALVTLLTEQPELGFVVVSSVGPRASAVDVALRAGASGLIVVATAHTTAEINQMTRAALEADLRVHLSTGLQGVTHRRVRVLPLSYEPLLSIESNAPGPLVLATKRAADLALASLLLVLALPVLAISALAIKLGDRGPVLFRQERIGRSGRSFTFYKLRTMTPGSDARLDDVWERNARQEGPLFKDPSDPRRTRVGRVLEATSIDELPQLWNVLRGDMSLVGPRPALPHEVAQFDDELLRRHTVRPGITGLWQVEGRDNPHFRPYRRLDLVYVENLSLALDVVILSTTAQIVLARAATKLFTRTPRSAPTTCTRDSVGDRVEPVLVTVAEHEREPEIRDAAGR